MGALKVVVCSTFNKLSYPVKIRIISTIFFSQNQFENFGVSLVMGCKKSGVS
jgi:hypothetical protein